MRTRMRNRLDWILTPLIRKSVVSKRKRGLLSVFSS
ncbi:hypothetical protein OIU78_009542, partial [Salix suchowensis]